MRLSVPEMTAARRSMGNSKPSEEMSTTQSGSDFSVSTISDTLNQDEGQGEDGVKDLMQRDGPNFASAVGRGVRLKSPTADSALWYEEKHTLNCLMSASATELVITPIDLHVLEGQLM
jgi:hypothetical protein